MVNLDGLRVLHAVAGAGSMERAAATLQVTTSAVSQQLAQLEREVGQALVRRQGRGLRLTDAGQSLAEHARRLLAEMERVEADLAGRRGAVAGTLTVAGCAIATRGLLSAAACALRVRHPGLSVRLAELEPAASVPALGRADVDLALVHDWPESPRPVPDGLSCCHLFDEVLDIALPATHPLAGRAELALAELADVDWVTGTSGPICADWLAETLAAQGVAPRIRNADSAHTTQLALVGAGVGVAVIPRLGREPVPDTVHMVRAHPVLRRRISLLWRDREHRRPAMRAALRAFEESVEALIL